MHFALQIWHFDHHNGETGIAVNVVELLVSGSLVFVFHKLSVIKRPDRRDHGRIREIARSSSLSIYIHYAA